MAKEEWAQVSTPLALIGSRHLTFYDIILPLSSSFLSAPEHLPIWVLV